MKSKKKIIITTGVTLLLIILIGWKLNSNKKVMDANAAVANEKTVIFPVTITNAKMSDLKESLRTTGILNPVHTLSFVSEATGRIQSIAVVNGQYVNKGQIIAQIDNEQLSIDLKVAQANFEKAKTDVEKFKTMLETNAITKQQYEDQKLNFINAEARLATLNRQLRTTTITSPISGSINKLYLEVGSFLTPGAAIAEIVDIKELKMQIAVLDRDVVKLKTGDVIAVTPDLYPDSNYKGKIVSIASKADESRKFQVEILIENNQKMELKGGMSGTAHLDFITSNNSLLIPVKCIVGSLQDPKVFVINGDQATLKPITTGYSQGDYIEVLSGLSTAENIVETGQLNIAEGSKVQIIK
jgi:RND family efflux transporter MFP subunit